MYVMMYVVCVGRTDRYVIVKINGFVDVPKFPGHPPAPRCLRFQLEFSKFKLCVGDLWVVLTHEYHKVLIRATHDKFFHLTITEENVYSGKDLISARIDALTET